MQVRSPGSYSSTRGSVTLGKPGLLQGMLAVRPRHLTAKAWCRKDLPRIREPFRVERPAEALHRGEVVLAEHQRHRAGLVTANSVLARDRAARIDAGHQD